MLANEQVIQGRCERCGTLVERRELTQWFFKITDYAQRLLDDVELLTDWPERVVTMQRNWIGRSEGAEVDVHDRGDRRGGHGLHDPARHAVGRDVLRVRGRAPGGASAGRAGRHLATRSSRWSARREQTSLVDREAADTKEGVFLGVHAVNPVNGERIPCYAAPYVLMGYGTGAIMARAGARPARLRVRACARHAVRVVVQPADGAAASTATR